MGTFAVITGAMVGEVVVVVVVVVDTMFIIVATATIVTATRTKSILWIHYYSLDANFQ